MKELSVGNIVFTLNDNGRLYGKGNGYVVSSVVDSEKIYLNSTEDVEIDMCIKDIEVSDLSNTLVVRDTRDGTYDLFVSERLHPYYLYGGIAVALGVVGAVCYWRFR